MSDPWPWLRAGAALVAIVALTFALGRAARRLTPFRGFGAPAGFAIVGTLALDPRRRLHLVSCPGGRALVLTGGASDALLPWPAEAPPAFPDLFP